MITRSVVKVLQTKVVANQLSGTRNAKGKTNESRVFDDDDDDDEAGERIGGIIAGPRDRTETATSDELLLHWACMVHGAGWLGLERSMTRLMRLTHSIRLIRLILLIVCSPTALLFDSVLAMPVLAVHSFST
jgi:hypothetical protein